MEEQNINDIEAIKREVEAKMAADTRKDLEQEIKTVAGKKSRKRNIIIFWCFFLVCISAYFVVHLPEFIVSVTPQKPLRYGSYATDKNGDDCINALWEAAAGVKDKKCPLTGVAYQHKNTGICCPNPEKHNLKSLCFESDIRKVRATEYGVN